MTPALRAALRRWRRTAVAIVTGATPASATQRALAWRFLTQHRTIGDWSGRPIVRLD